MASAGIFAVMCFAMGQYEVSTWPQDVPPLPAGAVCGSASPPIPCHGARTAPNWQSSAILRLPITAWCLPAGQFAHCQCHPHRLLLRNQ
jgi:hypothetical protein